MSQIPNRGNIPVDILTKQELITIVEEFKTTLVFFVSIFYSIATRSYFSFDRHSRESKPVELPAIEQQELLLDQVSITVTITFKKLGSFVSEIYLLP
jgi:hypothetical protein